MIIVHAAETVLRGARFGLRGFRCTLARSGLRLQARAHARDAMPGGVKPHLPVRNARFEEVRADGV